MRKIHLCNPLRRPYTPKHGMGTVRSSDPKYKNIWFVVPPAPPTQCEGKLPVKALAEAYDALKRLPKIGHEDELDRFVDRLFQRREALASSRMEGTWSTMDHVLTPTDNDGLNRKSMTASVRGYAEGLESNLTMVLKKRYKVFTPTFVKGLHKTIVSKDPHFDGTPGSLRRPGKHRGVVFIGGMRKEDSLYNPAPPEHVDRTFKEVLAWYRNDLLADMGDAGMNRMTLPVRLAIGHAHFEAVHPFQDGNGRVGRMLWPFQMALAGISPLYLSGYIEGNKDRYAGNLRIAQMRLQYDGLIGFMCRAIVESCKEAEKTKDALLSLPKTWNERATFRKSSAAARALPLLIKNPIINANGLADSLDISFQAASSALKSLAERKVVAERTGQERNRIFAAEEVIALIARPFGEDPGQALVESRGLLLK